MFIVTPTGEVALVLPRLMSIVPLLMSTLVMLFPSFDRVEHVAYKTNDEVLPVIGIGREDSINTLDM